MTAFSWWLLYVALVGWGLFGVLVWLTWNLSWRDLRWRAALKSDGLPRFCIHGSPALRFCEHCAIARQSTQAETGALLERLARESQEKKP